MKITKISNVQPQANTLNSNPSKQKNQNNPAFGSLGMSLLGGSGALMQWIENKGYFISFLIQDGLGMTLPRVWTGFHRDKEVTGKYNMQEGWEVLGREAITGPYMVSVAPIVLALTGKFCKSTNTNTRLIKRFGESLKNMIKSPEFDKSIQQDSSKFKNEFFKYNLNKIYKDSVPNDKNADETVKYLLEEFEKFDSKNKKNRAEALKNIQNKINSKKTETSAELYELNKLYVGEGETKRAFNMSAVLTALKDYGDDAIGKNKDCKLIDEKAAENIKNNFATKRLLTNITNLVVTLAGLSIIPKLYARSDVAPGAHTLAYAKEQQKNNSAPAFKGRGINNEGIFSKFGKFLTKRVPEKAQELLEYTGYNFSKTTFAGLSIFGLLVPRGKRAWDRAQIDENGKRDLTELHEIILRDTVSSLSVVFAVPCLTKLIVSLYEDKTGFILTNRASDGKNFFKKALDILWPYSNLEVLSVADLDSIYGNIDSKTKLLNFSKFVNEKGGDLEKILSKSENASLMFNEKSFTLNSIKHLSKEEKNKKIISEFEKLNNADELISKLMKGTGELKNNRIAKMARGLNSIPGVLSTVLISPIILGILIPKLTYHNTRRTHAKRLQAQNQSTQLKTYNS